MINKKALAKVNAFFMALRIMINRDIRENPHDQAFVLTGCVLSMCYLKVGRLYGKRVERYAYQLTTDN